MKKNIFKKLVIFKSILKIEVTAKITSTLSKLHPLLGRLQRKYSRLFILFITYELAQ
jgi:hypothetical protein